MCLTLGLAALPVLTRAQAQSGKEDSGNSNGATVATTTATGLPPAPPHMAPSLAATPAPSSLRALIVGGGPNLSHNQVAIESNVRYVTRLLPLGTRARTLFADGNPHATNVLYEDEAGKTNFRAPQIPGLDGPSRREAVHLEIAQLASLPAPAQSPLLLYFTGHGSPNRRNDLDNNDYDLWGGQYLSVRDLAREISVVPAKTPVVVVMAQCFSGAFGNLIFQNGDPGAPLIAETRSICGFFASIPQREAAGCTPEINEANYHDFTGYFFAALGGKSRIGATVTGADFNHDGVVGMDEAFAYALIHDESIDTPVCTSDVFLRRFVKMPDGPIFQTPYTQARSWASLAQRAALEALSQRLHLTGEDRLDAAYRHLTRIQADSENPGDVFDIRFVRLAKSVVLAHQLEASTVDPALKARYLALRRAEAANPIAATAPDAPLAP